MHRHTHWLISVQNGNLLEDSPLAWATWESDKKYLPTAFYDVKSMSSLSAQSEFAWWVGNDPIIADGDTLASYDQVELITLAFGLAFRALWVAQFPGIYFNVPPYILNSSYPFTEYEQLSHKIENIISGYIDMYVPSVRLIVNRYPYRIQRLQELEVSYPTWNSMGKASTSQKTMASAEGEKGKVRADKQYVMLPHPSNTYNIPIPSQPFKVVTMDFIPELPECEGYNNVLVIVDKLMKYTIFIPTTTTLTEKGTAALFFQHVISQYGIPRQVITD